MSKAQQAVYDAIKKVREGYEAAVSIEGKDYTIVPWEHQEQEASGYCQLVLCKYHGRKIGIQWICWKDAGPNPRLYGSATPGSFIPFKNVYGVVKQQMENLNGSKTPDCSG
jgi:hypothetical protein